MAAGAAQAVTLQARLLLTGITIDPYLCSYCITLCRSNVYLKSHNTFSHYNSANSWWHRSRGCSSAVPPTMMRGGADPLP